MASNNDSSGKGGAKPGSDAQQRPSALIDLKPTEVDIKDPTQAAKPAATVAAAAAQAAAAPGAGATSSAASAKVGTSSATATKPADAAAVNAKVQQGSATGSAPAAGKAAAGSANAAKSAAASGDATGGGDHKAQPAMRPTAESGGLRGAATHLVAGLAGGLLALLGAEALLPKAGTGGADQAARSQAVDARLKSLEIATSRQPAPELVQRLATAEQRLADYERAAKSIEARQEQLAVETKSLGEKLEASPAGGADAEKLAKLEETLSTLAAAALNDPSRGRIPQLAAIAGKLTDLESGMATQITQLRKAVTQEVDSRLSQSSDAAQAARAGTQRLDRELASVKNDAAQIMQRVDGLKAQNDRIETGVQGLREETTALKAEIGREMQNVARAADVSTAISPLTSKLSVLEQNVQGVVRNEDDRRQNVERIVTALELGNLKRTIERGVGFTSELTEVRRVAGPKIDLSVLERYRERGVPSLGELEREFKAVAFAIIDADSQPADAHWTDKLIASAKSVVRIRKVEPGADDKGVDSTVARMEQSLKAGRLAEVAAEAGKLSAQARAPAKAWLEKVEGRAAVERAISAVEQELKASLGAQGQAGKKG